MAQIGSSKNPKTTYSNVRAASDKVAQGIASAMNARRQGLPTTAKVNAEKSAAARQDAMQRFSASNQARHGG